MDKYELSRIESIAKQLAEPLARIARALEVLALQSVAKTLRRRAPWSEGADEVTDIGRLEDAADSLAWRIREDHLSG